MLRWSGVKGYAPDLVPFPTGPTRRTTPELTVPTPTLLASPKATPITCSCRSYNQRHSHHHCYNDDDDNDDHEEEDDADENVCLTSVPAVFYLRSRPLHVVPRTPSLVTIRRRSPACGFS
jgi:hypothetical protein